MGTVNRGDAAGVAVGSLVEPFDQTGRLLKFR